MKKALIVGCSHGALMDRSACDQVIKFRDRYKPDEVIHLGDFLDTTAFRSGARGTADEGKDVDADVLAGLTFMERLRPTVVFSGNHEARIWKHFDDPSALISKCARDTAKHVTKFIREELRAKFVDSYNINRSWLRLGPYLLGHGWMYGENAVREHAELMATNCIIAHTHSFAVARGRVHTGATCISVGMLADYDALSYAHQRKATSKWTVSFLSCEYDDKRLHFTPHIIREPAACTFASV